MKKELKYIELKSGHSDDGPAWIGYVEFSKSGRTVYFDDKAFNGNGHGSCHDIETGDVYWITGIKSNGNNRHVFGRGIITIDADAIEEYQALTGIDVRSNTSFEIGQSKPVNKKRFEKLLNEKL
jgi:hypothetical protein